MNNYNYNQNSNKNSLISNLFNQLRYTQRYLAEQQVKQLLHQIHSLQPNKDTLVNNNGQSELLLKLEGTIPMTFQNRQYNIPVRIWLPSTFPMHAPRCYVTPVNGMCIKPKHKLVDTQGYCYHPYLSNWNQNHGSSLTQLIAILSSEFGKDPPVYSGPPQKQMYNKYQQNNYQPRPQPNLNQNKWGNKPQNNISYNQPQQNSNNNFKQSFSQRSSNINNNMNNLGYNKQKDEINRSKSLNNRDNYNNNNDFKINNNSGSGNTKKDFENKIKPYIKDCYDDLNKECKDLATKRKEIEEHTTKLDTIEEGLQKEHELLKKRKQDLSDKIQYLEKWIKENDNKKEIDINDIVLPSDKWSEQIIEETAKDFAGTDSLLELDRAIDDNTLKMDSYMKQIRKVAREQFMHRALAKIIFEKQDSLVKQKQQQRN